MHRAGKIRIIATSGTRRSTLLPDVATFREQGLAEIEGTGWIAMYAPAGTPKASIDTVSAAMGAALRILEVREQLVYLGHDPTGASADELKAISEADAAR